MQVSVSAQVLGLVPRQRPPEQESVWVQRFPSSQELELLVKTQPVREEQESVVQELKSLQVRLGQEPPQPVSG